MARISLVLAVFPAGHGQGAGLQLAGDPPLSAPWPTSMELKGTPMHRQPAVGLVQEVMGYDSLPTVK